MRVPLWGGAVSLPKSDTNPLTLPEHPCYYPHRSNTNLTISRRNQKLGKPTRPTRGLNASAHPNGPRAGPRHKRRSPSPHPHRVPCPFPDHPGDGGSIDSTRHAPFQGPLPNRCPLSGERLCVGIYFAGEAKRPGVTGIRAIEPLRGSTVVTIGELRSAHDDFEPNAVPHSGRALAPDGLPHSETPSTPASLLRHVWGFSRSAADPFTVGADVVVSLLQSPGPPSPTQYPTDRIETEPPQSKMEHLPWAGPPQED